VPQKIELKKINIFMLSIWQRIGGVILPLAVLWLLVWWALGGAK
jgi:hypothetical protein